MVGCHPSNLCSVKLPWACDVATSLLCLCQLKFSPSVRSCLLSRTCHTSGTPTCSHVRTLLCQSRSSTARGSLWNYVSVVHWERCVNPVSLRTGPSRPCQCTLFNYLLGNYSHISKHAWASKRSLSGGFDILPYLVMYLSGSSSISDSSFLSSSSMLSLSIDE